jgi:hypothetical protein
MLVETKGITEMGLVFGNTWHVIGLVIAAILIFAFLGNALVARMGTPRPRLAYVLLLASLGLGLFVAGQGGFTSTAGGRLATTVVLTCPLFFSGIVFSALLSQSTSVARAIP